MSTRPPLADTLPFAADFVIEILAAASRAPFGQLSWVEINRLAARWLRPPAGASGADSSRLGHEVVIEMSAHGLLDVEMTSAADGRLMVQHVAHPRIWGVRAARTLAA
ncbi:hypothetical protein [Rubrivirga sp. IMCC43871]|uniref:hypothetical protein n=1 Tax=Rubrivirga sp. IMCC43871 TaxID=3391575 RepID=UPI00398FFD4F